MPSLQNQKVYRVYGRSDQENRRPQERLWDTMFTTLDPRRSTNPYYFDRNSSTHSVERIVTTSSRKTRENGSRSRRKSTINVGIVVVLLLIVAFTAVAVALLAFPEQSDDSLVEYTGILALNRTWDPNLADSATTEYTTLVQEFTKMIDAAYGASDLSSRYIGTSVIEFREGSIVVLFQMTFNENLENAMQTSINPTLISDTLVIQIIQDQSSNSDTQFLASQVLMSSVQVVEIPECTPNLCVNGDCVDGVNGPICNCVPGYSGIFCEENIDECLSDPCIFGSCIDGVNSFTCNCSAGYNGTLCGNDIDECTSDPCVNGECIDQVNGVSCNCSAGYMGKICELDIDECSSDPCVNGSCVDQVNGFYCNCSAGFNGTTCENDIDECSSNPCIHGSCIDQVNGFYCNCSAGYNGTTCDNDIDDCSSSPCLNGSCIDQVNGFYCNCSTGYSGTICDNDIDECYSNPCVNGSCIDQVNGFYCNCSAGYNGTVCDIDIDECSSDPCVNGICIDQINDFYCNCSAGYNGTTCDNDIDDCSSDPCMFGTCIDQVNDFYCNCSAGYNGTTCDNNIDECASDPCMYGFCVDQVNDFYCNCSTGFNGTTCDNNIDDCPPDPCVNGTCIDQINGFYCNCSAGYNGTTCNIEIDECASNPCVNGSCTDQVNGFYCNCSSGFNGTNCENNIDDCSSSPCDNGVCIDLINDFYCNCSDGFNGTLCDNDIDECLSVTCVNSPCLDLVNGFRCKCKPGFGGTLCEEDIDECSSNPCPNGECFDEVNGFHCNCSEKFNGTFCEEVLQRDCTFENGQDCFLMQSTHDNFDWVIDNTGGTPTKNTGPSAANEGTLYAYIDTASNVKEDIAILQSIDLIPAGMYCLSFDYHMYGITMGSLEVRIIEFPLSSYRIFKKTGDYGQEWRTELIALNTSSKYQLLFVGTRGGSTSDLALDNILLLTGDCACKSNPCLNGGTCESANGDGYQCFCEGGFSGTRCENVPANATLQCTFEDDIFCFLTQSLDDDYDWRIIEGETVSSKTGPSAAVEGLKYAYIENAGIISENDKAVFTTHPLSFQDGDWCLSLNYHLFGDHINKLEVHYNSTVILSRTGPVQDIWVAWRYDVHLFPSTELRIIASAGSGGKGDIAIDNISLSPGNCVQTRTAEDKFNQSLTDVGIPYVVLLNGKSYDESRCRMLGIRKNHEQFAPVFKNFAYII